MNLAATPPVQASNSDTSYALKRPVKDRIRSPSTSELSAIPWFCALLPSEREQVTHHLQVAEIDPGEYICRIGRAPSYWFGVIEGLLKMTELTGTPRPLGFVGVSPGGWCTAETLMNRETYRHDICALRRSVVAVLPLEIFHTLLASSLAFNHYLLCQSEARFAQFLASREIDRRIDPDLRVARHLAALSHPRLFPCVGGLLRITQQELGQIVGLSRQRVNEALGRLEEARLIEVVYGGVRVMHLTGLEHFPMEDAANSEPLTAAVASSPEPEAAASGPLRETANQAPNGVGSGC